MVGERSKFMTRAYNKHNKFQPPPEVFIITQNNAWSLKITTYPLIILSPFFPLLSKLPPCWYPFSSFDTPATFTSQVLLSCTCLYLDHQFRTWPRSLVPFARVWSEINCSAAPAVPTKKVISKEIKVAKNT